MYKLRLPTIKPSNPAVTPQQPQNITHVNPYPAETTSIPDVLKDILDKLLQGGGKSISDLLTGGQKEDEDANEFNRREAEVQRNWEAAQAQKMMDFQERMSNTQLQRLVEDARKAGINPSAVLGGGSAPAGSMASTTPTQYQEQTDKMFDMMSQILGITSRILMIKFIRS